MRSRKHVLLASLVLPGLLVLGGCALFDQLASSLLSLQRLQFKLGSVHDFSLLGVRFGGKSTLRDFSAMDGFCPLPGIPVAAAAGEIHPGHRGQEPE